MALGLYGPEGLQWAGGGNAAGVQVFVFLPGTTTKIPLFLDDQGEFSAANPVTSDQMGRIAFYAEQGSYDLVINSTRFAINISDNIGDPPPKLVQLADVEVVNPTDGQSVVWEAATSRWKNKMVSGGGGGAVNSVFGRTGAVVAQNGDYTAAQVGAAPTVHTHGTGDVTGLNAFVTAIANAAAAAAVNAVIDAAPGSLDTLNEIAAALGDDPNFATTITNLIAGKQNADPDLTAIAALAPADGSLIQRISGVWNSQTTTQVKASMGLSNVDNTSDVDKPVSTAQAAADALRVPLSLFDAAGDLLVGTGNDTAAKLAKGGDGTFLGVQSGNLGYFTPSGGGDRMLYEPSADGGLLEWSCDTADCSADFGHNGGVIIMQRFRWRSASTTLSEIGFCITSGAASPGAFSGVALYEDGTGVVNRLGQSADAGTQWTTQGRKSIALTAPVTTMVQGNYYRAALLWQGTNPGRLAGKPLVILDALFNAGTRRGTVLTGQSAFPSSVNVSTMTVNNALYWMSFK